MSKDKAAAAAAGSRERRSGSVIADKAWHCLQDPNLALALDCHNSAYTDAMLDDAPRMQPPSTPSGFSRQMQLA